MTGPSARRRPRYLMAVVACIAVIAACGTPATEPPRRTARAGDVRFTSLAPDVYRPCGLAVGGDAVWALSCSGQAVGIREGGPRVTRGVEGEIVGLDALAGDDGGPLWVTTAVGSGTARHGAVAMLVGVDGGTGGPVDLGASIPMHAVWVGDALWVATNDGGLYEVRGTQARRAASGPPLLWAVAEGSRFWTVAENGDVVERSETGATRRTYAGVLPNAHAAGAGLGAVWLAAEGRLLLLDGATGNVSPVDVAGTVNHFERCGGSMWVSQPDFGVRSVDRSGAVIKSVPLDAASAYLACDGSRLWIVSEDGRLGSIDVTR